MFTGRIRLVAIAAIVMLAAATAAAQQRAGQLSGRVVDEAGVGLPGAAVSVAGPARSRVVVTDAAGSFFVAALPPGAYVVRLSREGALTESRVRVAAGRRVHVSAIVRAAAGPLAGATGSITTMTADDLDQLPASRDPMALLGLVPGVLPDRVGVGGGERGQNVTFVAAGAGTTQNSVFVNGVNITDMSGARTTPNYVDLSAVEQVQVVTGAYGAEYGAGSGAAINIATKTGTNAFAGFGSLFAGFGQQADQPGSQLGGNLYDNDYDAGAAVGGPIIPDRIWFFGAVSGVGTYRQTHAAGIPVNNNFSGLGFSAHVNGTLGSSNKWSGYAGLNPYDRAGEGASATRPPETTWNQNGQTNLFKIEDTHVFTSNFYLTGMAAHVNQGFQLIPQGDAATAFEDDTVFRGNYYELDTRRTSTELSIRGGYTAALGSQTHALTFGMGRRSFLDVSTAGWPGDTFSIFRPGEDPIAVFTPRNERAIQTTFLSAYAQDTLTYGKLTVDLGLRFDRHTYLNKESGIAANPTFPLEVPSATFPQRDGEFSWTHVSPRLSASYDLKGDGRFIASAAYSTGMAPLWTDVAALTNPIEIVRPLQGSTAFRFLDANANRRYDAGEVRGGSIIVGGIPTNAAAFFDQKHQVQAGLDAPTTHQFTGGLDFQVNTDVTLGARYTHQTTSKLLDYVNLVDDGGVIRPVTPSDFLPGAPILGFDLDGDPFSLPAFYLDPALSYTGHYSVTNGDRRAEYHGVSLFFNKRLSNRWMLRGHLTLSDWAQEVPSSYFEDANDLVGSGDNDGAPFADTSADPRKTGVYLNSRWMFNVEGLYDLGQGWTTSARMYGRQGLPYATFVTDQGPDGLERQFQFEPLGARRLDNPVVADFRVRKSLTFGRYPVDVSLDVFNAFGSRTVLGREGDLASPRKGLTTEFLNPRAFQVGARIRF